MPVKFDTTTGRLRLDQEAFDALVAWAAGRRRPDSRPDARLAELRDAGVVERGRPHPALVPGLEAVTEPVCQLTIVLRDGRGRGETGQGWVCGSAAALLLDLPDGLRELVTVHPSFLPAALARIVQLGPRPRLAAAPVQVPPALLERFMSPDPEQRAGAARELAAGGDGETAGAAGALASGLRRRWGLRVSWPAPQGMVGERGLEVLDTMAGCWLLEPTGTGLAVAWPTTPTALWRAFVLLLPRDEELA